MKAMRVPRPETLSTNDDGNVVELNSDGMEVSNGETRDEELKELESERDDVDWTESGSSWSRPRLRRAPPVSSIRGWWRWLWTTLRIPDSMIFRIYGIDVWSYLQFLKFCIAVFFILTIIGLTVYLPTNMTGGNQMKGFNSTGMGNLPPGDQRAYIHLIGTYAITFIITVLAFKYFKQFTRYRQRYKKLALLNNFSCMVTNVPISKGTTTSAKLQAFFEKLYPNQVASATLLFNLKPLERKIKDRQAFIIALDRAIATYQATGVRPMHSLEKVASKMSAEERKTFGIDYDESNKSSDSHTPEDHNVIPLDEDVESGKSRVSTIGEWNAKIVTGELPSKKNMYMADSMMWYQKQIDDLDEEIELERKRVEESEDLQEAVPMVIGAETIITTIPAPQNEQSNIHGDHHHHHHHHHREDDLGAADTKGGMESDDDDGLNPTSPQGTPSASSSKKSANRQSVLWRLSKRIQPDREEDEDILNEPFELSDIPAEVDPTLATLTEEERRILAATTALVDPKYATLPLTGQTDFSYGNVGNDDTSPRDASYSNMQSSMGEAGDAEMLDQNGNPLPAGALGPNGLPIVSTTVASTPTIEAAKARRLTRSLSRHFGKQLSKSGFNAVMYSGTPASIGNVSQQHASTINGNGDMNEDSLRNSTADYISQSPTASQQQQQQQQQLPQPSSPTSPSSSSSIPSSSNDFIPPRLTSSGSLSHLPIISGTSSKLPHTRTHSNMKITVSAGGNMQNSQSSMNKSKSGSHFGNTSANQPSQTASPNQSFVDYDPDEDEDEEERRDAQEGILDRLMIRVPGRDWIRKTWQNWVVGAPKEVMGSDGIIRESVYRPTTVGFVTFKTIVAANHCAHSGYLSKSFFKWRVEFAPAESDILWRNMRLGWWQQWIRYLIMVVLVCGLIIFWGVPVGFMARWANIDHLEQMGWSHNGIVWLKSFGPFVVEVMARLSPTVTLLIFMNLLVPVIRVLFDYVERPATKSGQEMKVFRTYYAFLLFNVLFLSTLTSQISNIVNELIRNPSNTVTDLARHLGENLPVYGAFFINYILNAAFLSGAMGLPRLMFFIFHFIQLKFAKSPTEIEKVKKESVGGFEYDYQYAAHLNIFTIALAYSSMQPLILPAALVYFVLWFAIDKYNLSFAYDDNFDRSGAWTPLVFRRVFAAIAIFHFTMFGTFLVKQNYFASGLLLPMFVFDLLVHWYAINTFALRSQYVPLDEATRYPHTAYQLGLEDGYIHPAMHDLPDSLYSTRYETRPANANVHFASDGNDDGSTQQAALRFHPSLARDSSSATVASNSTAHPQKKKKKKKKKKNPKPNHIHIYIHIHTRTNTHFARFNELSIVERTSLSLFLFFLGGDRKTILQCSMYKQKHVI
jgi:hypothetical protein